LETERSATTAAEKSAQQKEETMKKPNMNEFIASFKKDAARLITMQEEVRKFYQNMCAQYGSQFMGIYFEGEPGEIKFRGRLREKYRAEAKKIVHKPKTPEVNGTAHPRGADLQPLVGETFEEQIRSMIKPWPPMKKINVQSVRKGFEDRGLEPPTALSKILSNMIGLEPAGTQEGRGHPMNNYRKKTGFSAN
jgi:hypothetical protein